MMCCSMPSLPLPCTEPAWTSHPPQQQQQPQTESESEREEGSTVSVSLSAPTAVLQRTRSFSADTRVSAAPLAVSTAPVNGANAPLQAQRGLEEYIQKTRSAALFLQQLLHARLCRGTCRESSCMRCTEVLAHVAVCTAQRCSSGCATTKRLLAHADACRQRPGKAEICLMCTLAKAPRLRRRSNSSSGAYTHTLLCLPVTVEAEEERERDAEVEGELHALIETRVPFQSPPRSTPRVKTFSDSDCALSSPSQYSNNGNSNHASPFKKARSKSMTAVSSLL